MVTRNPLGPLGMRIRLVTQRICEDDPRTNEHAQNTRIGMSKTTGALLPFRALTGPCKAAEGKHCGNSPWVRRYQTSGRFQGKDTVGGKLAYKRKQMFPNLTNSSECCTIHILLTKHSGPLFGFG